MTSSEEEFDVDNYQKTLREKSKPKSYSKYTKNIIDLYKGKGKHCKNPFFILITFSLY